MSPADDPIALEAWRREASHVEGHRNYRHHLRPVGANLMGLRGEQKFGERYGLAVNLTPKLDGDGGIDFTVATRCDFPVDCKAAIFPKDLIVEAARIRPGTIYVLCRYLPAEDRCELLGWQWGRVLMRSEPKDYGYGVLNHWQPGKLIRDMSELDERVLRP